MSSAGMDTPGAGEAAGAWWEGGLVWVNTKGYLAVFKVCSVSLVLISLILELRISCSNTFYDFAVIHSQNNGEDQHDCILLKSVDHFRPQGDPHYLV